MKIQFPTRTVDFNKHSTADIIKLIGQYKDQGIERCWLTVDNDGEVFLHNQLPQRFGGGYVSDDDGVYSICNVLRADREFGRNNQFVPGWHYDAWMVSISVVEFLEKVK